MIVLLGGTGAAKYPCGHGYMEYENIGDTAMKLNANVMLTEVKCKMCKKEWFVRMKLVEYAGGKVSNNCYRVTWTAVQ